MKLFDIYRWATGSMADFSRQFHENEQLYNQAKAVYRNIENSAFAYIFIFIFVGALLACGYYKPYNNKPGRHYHPKYWCLFGFLTFLLSGIVTLILEKILVKNQVSGTWSLELSVSLLNAVYAGIIYIIVSIIWCNLFTTNAYKMFMFKK